jgi:hypothetical protein
MLIELKDFNIFRAKNKIFHLDKLILSAPNKVHQRIRSYHFLILKSNYVWSFTDCRCTETGKCCNENSIQYTD